MDLSQPPALCRWQVSGEDPDQYKRSIRGQIKQLTEQENDPLVGDWIVVYVWHAGIDPNSKGARKVSSCGVLNARGPLNALSCPSRECARDVGAAGHHSKGTDGHRQVQAGGGCQLAKWPGAII